ncbi:hypothetical protein [Planctomicrobium piriforme]|uniref:DUF1269 domain-containing protein n=1 Tax=Planctomicrobium piriforme TaxID=1576369 RepID=A0A1I3KWK8_9PLAN|nr:hypothetical protein [Planctomicrobium piriforme]SFI76921.1 hypothetical protein SAMN05421753_11267 [Planctomicrobium piriforme]
MSIYPVRAGAFAVADEALSLVNALHDHAFSWDEISVICSNPEAIVSFPEATRHRPTGNFDNRALNVAATSALGAGGIATAAILLSGGTAIMVLGGFAGVAAVTTFAALMATRGFESEATDFYEQAVQEGQILVAVEVPDSAADAVPRRELASRLITEAGAVAMPLAH